MLKLVKTLIPAQVRRFIKSLGKNKRIREEDRRLSAMNLDLDKKHVQNARIVPHRNDILDELPKGGIAVEVGVAQGHFSHQILERLLPAKLILIDMWESSKPKYGEVAFQQVNKRFEKEIEENQVELFRCFSWDGLNRLEPSSVDFVYIDASHDYDSVKKDLKAAKRVVRAAGIICGHDYIRWAEGPVRYGVVEAVNEFVINNEFEFIFLSNEQDRHISFAIRRIEMNFSATD